MCTGVLKQVVAKYIYNGSPVFACFLDASKAFDLVRHDILFVLLKSQGLSSPVVRLLCSWYSTQNVTVRWRGAFLLLLLFLMVFVKVVFCLLFHLPG